MLLRVDPTQALPVYEQIRTQVARLAASGQAPDGSRMPTIRQLAADLGLAKGTIERAYLLLEADGVIETRGRAGTFLIGPPTSRTAPSPDDLADLRDAADVLVVTARQLGATGEQAMNAVRQALERMP